LVDGGGAFPAVSELSCQELSETERTSNPVDEPPSAYALRVAFTTGPAKPVTLNRRYAVLGGFALISRSAALPNASFAFEPFPATKASADTTKTDEVWVDAAANGFALSDATAKPAPASTMNAIDMPTYLRIGRIRSPSGYG
jgi:hypothetical protein